MELNYEEDIKIDETALDVEWLEHSKIAIKYAQLAADKRKQAKHSEEKTKTVRSELINEANADPDNTVGKSKTNAADIEAYYRTHPRYKEAKEEEIEAQHEADMAELAQKEISYGRRKALENLAALHAQMYFAGPSAPRDLSNERQKKEAEREKQKEANKKVSSGMKRNK